MNRTKRFSFSALVFVVSVLFGLSIVVEVQATSAIWCHDELTYPETVFGDDTGEIIVGTDSSQKICTLGGSDSVQAGGGNDFVAGGDGDDTLQGEGGQDVLHGEAGNDFLLGGAEVDVLYGGVGDDELFGGAGNDEYLYALGDGHERIDDCFGDDTLVFPPSLEVLITAKTVGDDRVLTINHEAKSGSITLVGYEVGCSQLSIVYRSGDTNGDGTADGGDWMYWLYAYVNESARHGLADINVDGALDSADASCLQAQAQTINASCNQLITMDSTTAAGITVTAPTVVIPANAATISIPLSLTVSNETLNSVLFALQYDASKIELSSNSRQSIVAWNVSSQAVTLTDLNSQSADDMLNFLLVAPTNTGFDAGQMAAVTFDVINPSAQDELVDVQISSADFGVQVVPTTVTVSTIQVDERLSSLGLLIALGLLVAFSWQAHRRTVGG